MILITNNTSLLRKHHYARKHCREILDLVRFISEVKTIILYFFQKWTFTYHFERKRSCKNILDFFLKLADLSFMMKHIWWTLLFFCLFYFLTPISRGRYLIPLTCRANGELKRTQQKQCAITLWFFAEQGSWYDKIEFDHTCTINSSIIKFKNY